MLKHFMVIGNGGGGTSLLRGLLNAHSKLEVLFEAKHSGGAAAEIEHYKKLSADAESRGLLWANKVPLEQFNSRNWVDDDFIALAESFKIIWLIRRFTKYLKPGKANKKYYEKNWGRAQAIYWQIREAYPERIIQVSFEDLVLRPAIELKRICVFLEVRYEAPMLKGTMDTGYKKFDQPGINIEKV